MDAIGEDAVFKTVRGGSTRTDPRIARTEGAMAKAAGEGSPRSDGTNGYSRPKPSARTRSVGRLRAYMSAASPAAWTYFVLPVLDADAVKFLAQVGLRHLARGIPRQHVGEQYRAGLLVAGQLVLAKVDDVLLGGRRPALGDDDRAHRLAPASVGDRRRRPRRRRDAWRWRSRPPPERRSRRR